MQIAKSPENKLISHESPSILGRIPDSKGFSSTYNGFQNQTLLLDGKDLQTLADEKIRLKEYLDNQLITNYDLKSGYKIYKKKIGQREKELRDNIYSIATKNKIKDSELVIPSINELHNEIQTNVTEIRTRMNNDIFEKKKDIENRITIRLLDSEYRHKKFLDEKVKEQEVTLKSLHSVTQEMARIKENYENIKNRCNNYLKENQEFRKNIANIEGTKFKLQDELLNLKRLIYIINISMKTKNTEKSKDNNDSNNNMSRSITMSAKSRSSKINSRPGTGIKNKNINNNNNMDISGISKGSLKENLLKHHTEVQLPSIQLPEIKKIKKIINDDNFCKKNPIQANIIAAMTNVVENTKIKNKKLEEDLVCLKRGKNELTERVYQIIENTKNIPLSKSYSQSLTGTGQNGLLRASVGSGGNTRKVDSEVFISKEDRRRFIDAIVNDNNAITIKIG